MILNRLLLTVSLVFLNFISYANPGERVQVEQDTFYFDVVGLQEPVAHIFKFRNKSSGTLHVTNVTVTQPLLLAGVTSVVKAGEEGSISVMMGSPRMIGPFEGTVTVGFTNTDVAPITFYARGSLLPSIECRPMPAVFLATHRGESKTASIEVINHEKEPLQVKEIIPGSPRLKTRLIEIEPEKRFRLEITLTGEGKAGHEKGYVQLRTSLSKQPLLKIQVNMLIKERVSVFPDSIDLGILSITEVRENPSLRAMLAQTLMIYQHKGSNLTVRAETDLDFIQLNVEVAPTGDKAETRIELIPEKIKPGVFAGKIRLLTNDKQFSEISVPIKVSISAGPS